MARSTLGLGSNTAPLPKNTVVKPKPNGSDKINSSQSGPQGSVVKINRGLATPAINGTPEKKIAAQADKKLTQAVNLELEDCREQILEGLKAAPLLSATTRPAMRQVDAVQIKDEKDVEAVAQQFFLAIFKGMTNPYDLLDPVVKTLVTQSNNKYCCALLQRIKQFVLEKPDLQNGVEEPKEITNAKMEIIKNIVQDEINRANTLDGVDAIVLELKQNETIGALIKREGMSPNAPALRGPDGVNFPIRQRLRDTLHAAKARMLRIAATNTAMGLQTDNLRQLRTTPKYWDFINTHLDGYVFEFDSILKDMFDTETAHQIKVQLGEANPVFRFAFNLLVKEPIAQLKVVGKEAVEAIQQDVLPAAEAVFSLAGTVAQCMVFEAKEKAIDGINAALSLFAPKEDPAKPAPDVDDERLLKLDDSDDEENGWVMPAPDRSLADQTRNDALWDMLDRQAGTAQGKTVPVASVRALR